MRQQCNEKCHAGLDQELQFMHTSNIRMKRKCDLCVMVSCARWAELSVPEIFRSAKMFNVEHTAVSKVEKKKTLSEQSLFTTMVS